MTMDGIWTLCECGYDTERVISNGNTFLLGNGYLGCRGTLDEHTRAHMAAVNLAGVYDRCGSSWRETVNAPNPLFGCLDCSGVPLAAGDGSMSSHLHELDFRHGVSRRETVWKVRMNEKAPPVTVILSTERFVSMDDIHLLASRWTVTVDAACELTLRSGIDQEVYDCNGPHLTRFLRQMDEVPDIGPVETVRAWTGESGVEVAVSRFSSISDGAIHLSAGQSLEFVVFGSVYTSQDTPTAAQSCLETIAKACRDGYDTVYDSHYRCWEHLWEGSEVEIGGDLQAQKAINYSLYHLHCIAPRHGKGLSIAARGLSGQTYKGAVFWDTEIFMLPFFLHTEPSVARSFLEYRINGLPGALAKAAEYGFEGAFYAWESQEHGYEACSDYNVTDVFSGRPQRTYFRDKQIHISADVVYALWEYVEYTGDLSILREGGLEMILQCARFYYSYAYLNLRKNRIEFLDVIGPDEYHERVSNNAFTNRMVLHVFEVLRLAVSRLSSVSPKDKAFVESIVDGPALAAFETVAQWIYVPKPRPDGVVEQFDGYFKQEDCSLDDVRSRLLKPNEYWGGNNGVAAHTQVIKQADVIALQQLFADDYDVRTVKANWDYYEKRTEHGSSLSSCMYALTACRIGYLERAKHLFLSSALVDMVGGGKQFAGDIYIGGTHPASAGGAWMIAVLGFGGFRLERGLPVADGKLPQDWKYLRYRILVDGRRYMVTIRDSVSVIEPMDV